MNSQDERSERRSDVEHGAAAPTADETADANAIVPLPRAMSPEELDVRGDAVESVREQDAQRDAERDRRSGPL